MLLRFDTFVTQLRARNTPKKLNISSLSSQPKNTSFFNSMPNHFCLCVPVNTNKNGSAWNWRNWYFKLSGGFATNEYCPTINVTLKNDVLIHHDEYKFDEGLFQISAKINGKPSYVKDNSSIWYIPGGNNWGIGPLNRFF